ncbi:MAG: AraC family transcriptional regulator [Taibaiella sp.]|nr:AraC family transcriptional regulator [Taibaiella sp.]
MKVKTELNYLKLQYRDLESGVVEMEEKVTEEDRKKLKSKLHKYGMELLDSENSQKIERIIAVITEMIFAKTQMPKVALPEYLTEKLSFDYTDMSTIFSEVKGITIQQYVMINKIERVKEFLLYDELNLKEIVSKLNYDNIQRLSSEFKKVTGLSLAFFKDMKIKRKSSPIKMK